MSIWGELGAGAAVAEPEGVASSGIRAGDKAGTDAASDREFSVAEMRMLVDAACDWIWETDSQLRFSWLSQNYEAVTGIPAEDVLGRFRFDFLKQVSKGSVSAAAHISDLEARRPFRNFVYELNGARPDCRWISITGYPRFSADGKFCGYRGVARNVTSVLASVDMLEQANGRLAEERDRLLTDTGAGESQAQHLTAALNAMKEAFCFYDGDDRLVLYNQPFVDLYRGLADAIRPGVSYERLLDLGMERHLWDMEGADPAVWRMQALARRAERHWESTVKTTDGRWIMHREMRSDDGSVIGISADVTDLRERQSEAAQASEAARLVVSDLERTLDSLRMGVVLLDGSFRAQIINRAFYDIWKVTADEVPVGSHFRALMDINRHRGVYDVPDAQWETYVAARLAEIGDGDVPPREFVRRDGHTMIYSVTALSGGKRLVCYYDVTEMKNREVELAQAKDKSANLFDDLRRMVDSMSIGIIVLDANLRTEMINRSFYELWGMSPLTVPEGVMFRDLMEVSREIDTHGGDDAEWQAHIAQREAELRSGLVFSRKLSRSDGRTMMCAMAPLSGGKVLATYVDVTVLAQREAELAEAKDRAAALLTKLRGVVDAMSIGILVLDRDLRVDVINRAFHETWDIAPGRIAEGATLRDIMEASRDIDREGIDDAEWEAHIARREAEFSSGKASSKEVLLANGHTIICKIAPLAGGKTLASYVNVTDMKRREAELAEALERTKLAEAVIDGVRDPVFVKDSDLKFVIANRAFSSMFGLDPGDMVGKSDRDLFSAEEAERFEVAEHRVLATGEACEFEEDSQFSGADRTRIVRKDRVRTVSGKDYLSCFLFDVTEMKRRERDADEARNHLAGVLESLPAAVLVYDRDDNFVYANRKQYETAPELAPKWQRGCTLREAFEYGHSIGFYRHVGDPAIDALFDIDADRWLDAMMRHYRRPHFEFERLSPDGSWHQVYNMRVADGTFVGVRVDISELKRRQTEADDARKYLENVLESLPAGILIYDKDDNYVLANRHLKDGLPLLAPVLQHGSTFREAFELGHSVGHFRTSGDPALDALYHGDRDRWVEGMLTLHRKRSLEFERRNADGSWQRLYNKRADDGTFIGIRIDITEIKAREEALRASMAEVELLRHTLDELPVATSIKTDELRIEYVNKAWSSITGIRKDEAVGRTDIELFKLSEAGGYTRCDEDVLGTGRDLEVEEPVIHHDGTERQLMTRKSRLVAADGSVHLIGSSTDITEVKAREKALRASMNQVDLLRRTLDELPVMAFIKDEDLRIEYVNKAWTTLTGMSPEECVGRTDAEIFNLSEADAFNRDDVAVLRTGAGIETEEPLTHRDGTVRQMITRKSRLIAADGVAHLVGSATDISELKDREDRLNESLRENEVFRSLIDNVPVAIYAKRPDLRLFYVNKGWSDLTGLSSDEAIGKTDAEIFGPDGEAFMDGDRAVLETMTTQERAETVTTHDGSLQYQIARKSAMEATDGSLYLIGSTTDITELKQREKELEEAQRKAVLADRAKSEFLANMSHEIRTPMNGVLGMAELLAKSELSPKQKMFTDIIVKSGNALLTIINDILDFSKIDAGQLVLDVAPFNLAEAIEDVATLVSTRAKEKDLEMIVRVEPRCQQMFKGDVGRIRQIITNLLGNAVKFTEKGHVLVEVTGEPQGDVTKLKLSVTDTGIGIPADKLQLVFEKFSQVDASSTRRHEGTGLGLAITSRLVELMGGAIGVDSIEGEGSTFWFTVTLENAGEPADRRPPPLDVTGARILVVDDNAVNRAILSEQMQSWSFDSCAAESGAEGIRVLEAAAAFGVPVDCVVLDYQMPAMTGADAVRVIRSTPAIANTPVVMLTSVDQTLSNAGYRDLGIDAHLIKPARSSALLDALVTTIQKHRFGAGIAVASVFDEAPAEKPERSTQPPAVEVGPAVAVETQPIEAGDHRVDILVAEDNEVNQLVFTQILAETPYTFQIVGNGRLAVQAFGTVKPRMILMDVSMPEMNGMEATVTIRAAEEASGSRVPIVGVTAHALKGDRERCLESGMDDYLPKPISPKALLDKVEKWIGDAAKQRSAG